MRKQGLGGLLFSLLLTERKRLMAIAAELELPVAQAMMVWRVGENGGGLPMSALAEHAGCDPSNVTGVADKLEVLGLVRREAAEHDRRVKLLVLTDAGKQIVRRMNARLAEPPEWARALSAAERRTLSEILEKALYL